MMSQSHLQRVVVLAILVVDLPRVQCYISMLYLPRVTISQSGLMAIQTTHVQLLLKTLIFLLKLSLRSISTNSLIMLMPQSIRHTMLHITQL